MLTRTSPVAGDPTWGLRRRLLLDEERHQVLYGMIVQLVSTEQNPKLATLKLAYCRVWRFRVVGGVPPLHRISLGEKKKRRRSRSWGRWR